VTAARSDRVTPRAVVVGLGPAGPDLLTVATRDALTGGSPVYLRTTRHPAATTVPDASSFDHVYDAASSIDEVYPRIVDELVEAATEHGEIVYAVPGSPVVAERTVELLARDERVAVEILPALSFADLAWARLGVDPVERGVRLIDGRDFAVAAAGERGPLLVAQCDSRFVLSDIKLAVDDPGDRRAVVLQRLGLPDESIVEVPWADLDRVVEPDHLTALFLPEGAAPVASEVARFADLVATLRQECPWDREQTHQTLTRHLLEETYEVLEAIEALDTDAGEGYDHLQEELGDLLFQVLFHATLAAEAGQFDLADVARGIHDKLYARHPHVFGEVDTDDVEVVRQNWEKIKKAEKGRDSVMDGMPTALPALLLALKVQKKAAGAGMDFSTVDEAYDKVAEELGEVRADPSIAEVGDLLFAATSVAHELGIDPEAALRTAATRVSDRFRIVERLARERDIEQVAAEADAVDEQGELAKRAPSPDRA
jgi:tetrapyrrole methylase family protein/MazG family protein